ncbi:TPA: hypothetical protein HA291_02880 [Candidatus Micrarchaeota archaeon]|nr:hypothetical protein [Candidatus Micrarchaeota archaeon]
MCINPEKVNLAYVAGFFDAEGSITIASFNTKTQKRHQLRVSLSNSDKKSLITIKKSFLNFGSMVKLGRASGIGGPDTFEWRLGTRQAACFLEKISPFLVIKKGEAELAIKFQNSLYRTAGKFLADSEIRGRDLIKQEMTRLHKNRYIDAVDYSNYLLPYTAGLLDGDGYIGILHNTTPTVTISSTELKALEYLKINFDYGFIYKNRECFRWIVSSHSAKKFLEQLLPYFRLKGSEAALAIRFHDSIKSNNRRPVSKVELDNRRRIIKKIMSYHLKKGIASRINN